MKITIELSKKQLETIKAGLDIYSRILCGQLEEIPYAIQHADLKRNVQPVKENKLAIRSAIKEIKRLLFPEIAPSAYGIYAQEPLPKKAAIAYDIYQILHKLTDTEYYVSKVSDEEEFPIATIESTEKWRN